MYFQFLVYRIRQLRNRFDEYGYNALQFVLVITYLKQEKYRKKFNEEIEFLLKDDRIDIIKETKENQPFLKMGANQAFILDECSRLTYVIVPPWSHIQFPYIKAAILSTIYDYLCGECENEYILQPYPGYMFPNTSHEEIIMNILKEMSDDTNVNSSLTTEVPTSDDSTEEITETSTEEFLYTTVLPETTTSFYNQIDGIEQAQEYEYDQQPSVVENNDPLVQRVLYNESLYDDIDYPVNLSSKINSELTKFEFNETLIDDPEYPSDDNYSIPLKIILPVEHLHQNSIDETYSKYNYIVLKSDDSDYHEHLTQDPPIEFEDVLKDDDLNAKEWLNSLGEEGKELYVNQGGQIYQLLKEYYIEGQRDSFKEVELVETDIIRDEPKITDLAKETDIRRHYEYLVQWLTWQFE